MYMYLYHVIHGNHYNRITNRLKICLEVFLCLFRIFFFQINNKLSTISELNIRSGNVLGRHSCRCCTLHAGYRNREINLFSENRIISTLYNLQKSLSTGVYNACFFQNRQKFRCISQHFFHLLEYFTKYNQVVCLIYQFLSTFRAASCYRQDSSFLRLHNCLIRSLNCLSKCSSHQRYIHYLAVADFFGKST